MGSKDNSDVFNLNLLKLQKGGTFKSTQVSLLCVYRYIVIVTNCIRKQTLNCATKITNKTRSIFYLKMAEDKQSAIRRQEHLPRSKKKPRYMDCGMVGMRALWCLR